MHACKRGTIAGTCDCHLRNRSVDYAFRTKMMNEAFRDFESSAIDANVFSNAEDTRIALHLLPEPLSDCFKIGNRCHRVPTSNHERCPRPPALLSSFVVRIFLILGWPYFNGSP